MRCPLSFQTGVCWNGIESLLLLNIWTVGRQDDAKALGCEVVLSVAQCTPFWCWHTRAPGPGERVMIVYWRFGFARSS